VKLFFKDKSGDFRVVDAPIELDLDEQESVKKMIVRDAGVVVQSVVLSVVEDTKEDIVPEEELA